MKERPIIFSGPMVRAILDGRKTQTRRVVKPQPISWSPPLIGAEIAPNRFLGAASFLASCPYGIPGDRLWVRETWGLTNACYGQGGNWAVVGYRATNDSLKTDDFPEIELSEATARWAFDEFGRESCDANGGEAVDGDGFEVFRWRSSSHMPRWASRLTLEVVSVRVERLQDITTDDAYAEGYKSRQFFRELDEAEHVGRMARLTGSRANNLSKAGFRKLWDELNAKRGFGWDANPWVWVVEFRHAKETTP